MSASPSLPRCSRILTLDLGKFNSVLCSFDPLTAARSFVSLTTDRQTIPDRLSDAAGAADRSAILVVFETCEISGWVYDLTSEVGFKKQVTVPHYRTADDQRRCFLD